MNTYRTYVPGKDYPVEIKRSETSWDARRAYAEEHRVHPSEVVAVRTDWSPDHAARVH